MRAAGAALIAAVVLTQVALAGADSLPKGRVGAAVGLRFFNEEAAFDYPTNFVYGFEGGYQPGRLGLFGTLLFGEFDVATESSIGTTMTAVQMSFAARLTLALSKQAPLFFSLQAGVDLFRASQAVPIGGERVHLGPGAGTAIEAKIGPAVLSFAVRYALVGEPAGGLTALIAVGTGY